MARHAWTRRAILSSLPLIGLRASSGKGQRFPSERYRYVDPSTEFPVVRLTDPAYASYLPAWYGRTISRKGSFLLFWRNWNGLAQAFRLDQKSGELQQLTEAASLDGSTLRLAPDDRSFYYFDGPSLRHAGLSNLKDKEVYRVPDGWVRGDGFGLSSDGDHAALIERQDGIWRLRLLKLPKGGAATVMEGPWELSQPLPRPRREEVLYRRGVDSLWVAGYGGQQNRKLALSDGGVGSAFWSPEGQTVLYLNLPPEPRRPSAIRECDPDAGTERLVSETSQYAHFGANGDASVFVGASRSAASPHILLLLRSTRRELALCEHRARDPRMVTPGFSPDSQQICFESDRDGAPALYWVGVERLVERTES